MVVGSGRGAVGPCPPPPWIFIYETDVVDSCLIVLFFGLSLLFFGIDLCCTLTFALLAMGVCRRALTSLENKINHTWSNNLALRPVAVLSMQVVMNKCFLLNFVKKIDADPSCFFREKRKIRTLSVSRLKDSFRLSDSQETMVSGRLKLPFYLLTV